MSAPGQAWARRTDEIDNLKPCNGTQRGGSILRPAKLASSRDRVLRGEGRPTLRSVDREWMGRVIEPRKHLVVGADAIRVSEGSTRRSQRPDQRVPPGSESRARTQGFPRNLGDPAISAINEVVRDAT